MLLNDGINNNKFNFNKYRNHYYKYFNLINKRINIENFIFYLNKTLKRHIFLYKNEYCDLYFIIIITIIIIFLILE